MNGAKLEIIRSTVEGSFNVQCVVVEASGDLIMDEVTLSNCGGGDIGTGGVWGGNNTRITIDSSIIKNNRGTGTGGVQVQNFGSLHVKNTTFLNNTSKETAAITVYNSHANIKSSAFTSNKGGQTGDIIWIGSDTMAFIESTEFSLNSDGNIFSKYIIRCRKSGKIKLRDSNVGNNQIYNVDDSCKIT